MIPPVRHMSHMSHIQTYHRNNTQTFVYSTRLEHITSASRLRHGEIATHPQPHTRLHGSRLIHMFFGPSFLVIHINADITRCNISKGYLCSVISWIIKLLDITLFI